MCHVTGILAESTWALSKCHDSTKLSYVLHTGFLAHNLRPFGVHPDLAEQSEEALVLLPVLLKRSFAALLAPTSMVRSNKQPPEPTRQKSKSSIIASHLFKRISFRLPPPMAECDEPTPPRKVCTVLAV